MSIKQYVSTTEQCDKQGAARMNPSHFKGEYWDEFGVVVFGYVSGLVLSPWNADVMYRNDEVKGPNVEEMFVNVMCGYYILFINIMLLEEEYGEEWEKHSLPLVTLQNTFADCGCFVVRATQIPPNLPFMNANTIEYGQELHFSTVKGLIPNPRGMPKCKDMIVGASFDFLFS